LIFVFLIIFINYRNIGLFIIKQTDKQSTALDIRISEIGRSMAYGENASYMESRRDIPIKSLKVFIKNPFIGIGYITGYNYIEAKILGLGNHGEWADALAMMGILGGVPYLLIYFYSVKNVCNYSKRFASPAWIITLVMMGLFNPFKTFQSHFALFFMINAIGYLVNKER